ncbi:fumarate/nitrate reduction transcriptional regulator Fnr, partial [Kaarinaea lacus]
NVVELANLKTTLKDFKPEELCLPLDLSEQDVARLSSIVKKHYLLQPGEHLYHVGDREKAIYAVRSGTVKTYIPTNDGDEQVLGFYFPRELLGFEAFSHDRYNSAAVALETSDVCELPFDSLESLCRDIPGLRSQMHKLIGREIYNDHTLLLLLGKRHGEERLASFLLSISERLKNRGFSSTEFNLTMSRRDIGNYLGLAEETVSRLFTRFQEESVIQVERKHLTIIDKDRLHNLIDH